MTNRKMRVGMIYGGKSGEHEVSLSTAKAVISEFDFNKYEIFPIYITKQGDWRAGPKILQPIADADQLKFAAHDANVLESTQTLSPWGLRSSREHGDGGLDVLFPLLHGTFGEDGTVQGMMEMLNVPYVGAGVLASAVGMDKVAMKAMFAVEGLPQCIYRYFTRHQWEQNQAFFIMEIEVSLGYPCFVKPANLGSSVGISKARHREELIAAVQEAFQYDRKVIVEEFVDAREVEVSVLGNDSPRASVVGEIASSSEFYDYQAKYVDGKSVMTIPAQIPAETAEEVRSMAVRAFQAIDGTGLSRVDFFFRREDGALLINEINTMPGFTPFSMYPLLWRDSGVTYRELIDELLRLAIERHQEKQGIRYENNF
jgi:D-alanine-D-alanine ligase